ncbi:thioredoxin domain-containing protein [Novosphingobium sp. APW14]|uniref:thioredoxin domain-containing protein n=1 Tax=Novosphingobium sp. APW14 TaxID=3077237 RepID=UPI0028DE442C|nr:thioredoxin domain-containing protein [Novosphingobium sp. APW14]MDT9013385.1 thioredoxin domain-containing protein [Novosphingobium sp. APW14]
MTAAKTRFATKALIAATMAIALAACGKKDEGSAAAVTNGEPIAKIAPPAGASWADTYAVTPEGGYRMGNPDAPIKLVEYGALSCSHCAEFAEMSAAELRDNFIASGRVSYEVRFFMLNALDVPATLLATCGAPEAALPLAEQFWGWQKNMFANLQSNEAALNAAGQLPPEQRFAAIAQAGEMDSFFASRGIAADQAKICLADTAKATKLVEATNKAGQELNITGTPTFFLNGTKLDGNTWEAVKVALEKAGAR